MARDDSKKSRIDHCRARLNVLHTLIDLLPDDKVEETVEEIEFLEGEVEDLRRDLASNRY